MLFDDDLKPFGYGLIMLVVCTIVISILCLLGAGPAGSGIAALLTACFGTAILIEDIQLHKFWGPAVSIALIASNT